MLKKIDLKKVLFFWDKENFFFVCNLDGSNFKKGININKETLN